MIGFITAKNVAHVRREDWNFAEKNGKLFTITDMFTYYSFIKILIMLIPGKNWNIKYGTARTGFVCRMSPASIARTWLKRLTEKRV